jgi:hypothetical protein
LPRPLDGNGDGVTAFDMGAYEFNPYRLASPVQSGKLGFQFAIQSQPGRVVRIERSTDLIHWETWLLIESPVNSLDLFDPAAGDRPAQFYRTVRER